LLPARDLFAQAFRLTGESTGAALVVPEAWSEHLRLNLGETRPLYGWVKDAPT